MTTTGRLYYGDRNRCETPDEIKRRIQLYEQRVASGLEPFTGESTEESMEYLQHLKTLGKV